MMEIMQVKQPCRDSVGTVSWYQHMLSAYVLDECLELEMDEANSTSGVTTGFRVRFK